MNKEKEKTNQNKKELAVDKIIKQKAPFSVAFAHLKGARMVI